MKVEKLLGAMVCFGMVVALSATVALPRPAVPAQAAARDGGMRDRLQAAVESLNLTDEQKPKVKDIFADVKTKRQAIFTDSSLSEDQKKAKMKELHDGTVAKLNEVLTPDQQAELKSKMEAAKAAKKPAEQ
jgi:Spy/CpxP family protein refolding chaperone